jgi:pimeloyl-ACP methyl ester carboxylesterase
MTTSPVISFNNFILEYKIFGSGNNYILAFHGMGREADDFKIFEESLGKTNTIVAVNLFFHGNSFYPAERLFENQITKKEFVQLIEILLAELRIDRFTIMGYSLGGRVSLTLLQHLHKRIDKAILIAPDGLKRSVYNDFTTHTSMGKSWVQWMIKNPDKFFNIVNRLHAYKLMRTQGKKVIEIHFENHEKRVLLRNVISSLKYINPNLKKVAHNINTENIELVLIFGKYDFIIPAKLGVRFLRNITSKKEVHIIKASHNILTENASKALAALIS